VGEGLEAPRANKARSTGLNVRMGLLATDTSAVRTARTAHACVGVSGSWWACRSSTTIPLLRVWLHAN